jgi:hypothetical protein
VVLAAVELVARGLQCEKRVVAGFGRDGVLGASSMSSTIGFFVSS